MLKFKKEIIGSNRGNPGLKEKYHILKKIKILLFLQDISTPLHDISCKKKLQVENPKQKKKKREREKKNSKIMEKV